MENCAAQKTEAAAREQEPITEGGEGELLEWSLVQVPEARKMQIFSWEIQERSEEASWTAIQG